MKGDDLDFECGKCGRCCCGFSENKGVVLFPEDIDRISKKLNLTSKIFKTKYCYSQEIVTKRKTLTIYILRYIDGRCVFLNKSNLCEIHEFKPIQCHKGPIHIYWDDERWYNCESMRNIKLPEDWSTDEGDFKLISTFFND